jgi:hypothetical protein
MDKTWFSGCQAKPIGISAFHWFQSFQPFNRFAPFQPLLEKDE